MFDRRTRASRDPLLTLLCGTDITLWPEVIPLDTHLREASRLGVPLTRWLPEIRGAQAYIRLSDALPNNRTRPLRGAGENARLWICPRDFSPNIDLRCAMPMHPA